MESHIGYATEPDEVQGYEQFIGQFPNWVAVPKRPRFPGDTNYAMVSIADARAKNQQSPYYPPLH